MVLVQGAKRTWSGWFGTPRRPALRRNLSAFRPFNPLCPPSDRELAIDVFLKSPEIPVQLCVTFLYDSLNL